MGFFRSILGDIPIEKMGITYAHEHIVIDDCFATSEHPEFLLNDELKICDELNCIKRLGCATMVDTMPVNAGRNSYLSAKVSKRTGVNMIVPTGIHLEMYYPKSHWRYTYSEDQLTQLFIDDIEIGIDQYDYNGPIVKRTPHKAGLIKLATGDEPITIHQQKIFRAAVNAHLQTGAPILTHTNSGKQAIEQVELFLKLGANLKSIVISHVDRCKDLGFHQALLDTGVAVEYDSAFRWPSTVENWTYLLLEKLLPLYPNQIVVGMDAAKNTYWKSYGGKPGLDYLLTDFLEELRNRNLDSFIRQIFESTPASIYCFNK